MPTEDVVRCTYLLGRAGTAESLPLGKGWERRLHTECGSDLAAHQPHNAKGKKHKLIPPQGPNGHRCPKLCPREARGRKKPFILPSFYLKVLHSISCFLLVCLLPSKHSFRSREVKKVLQAPGLLSPQLRVSVVADNLSTNSLTI